MAQIHTFDVPSEKPAYKKYLSIFHYSITKHWIQPCCELVFFQLQTGFVFIFWNWWHCSLNWSKMMGKIKNRRNI